MFSFVASCLLLAIYVAGCSGEDCYGKADDCKPCGQCCNGSCNNKTGECSSGCKRHFMPPFCKDCEDGWWNVECTTRCGSCSNPNKSCNKSNGHCASCTAGRLPPLCTEYCPKGRYGPNCQLSCGNCSDPNVSCDPVTGQCSGKCLEGFIGRNCKTKCPRGTAGPNCVHLCRNCKDNECDPMGNCTLGCNTGYDGPKCENGGHDRAMFKAYVIGGSVGFCAVILILCVIGFIVFACRRNRRKKHALLTMHRIQKKLSDQARFIQVDPDTDPGPDPDTASICPSNPEAEPSQSRIKVRSNTCPDVTQTVETSSSGDEKSPVTVTKSFPGPGVPTVPITRLPSPPVIPTQTPVTPVTPVTTISSQDTGMSRASTNSNYVTALNSPGIPPYDDMAFSHKGSGPRDCSQAHEKEPVYVNEREIMKVRNMAKIFESNIE